MQDSAAIPRTTRTVPPTLTLAANAAPGLGGQGLNLTHMVEGLSPSFDTTLYCQKLSDRVPTTVVPRSPTYLRLARTPYIRRFRSWQTWLDERHFDWFVAARLKPTKLFQGATGQCLASLERARELGARTALDVVTLHAGTLSSEMEAECRRFGIESPIHPWVLRRMLAEYQRADLIRVMSRVAQRDFLERGFAADRVIVATPPLEAADSAQAEFREDVFRICHVGLIEPWKGFHHLLEAFDRLALPESEVVLWGWPGAGKIRRYLGEKMQRNPRIRLREQYVREAGFGEVYGKASVLVHPSLSDGFSYVVAEAMACGLPVIVTSRTGAADLVEDGVNGFVIAPRDVDALCDRLKFLATHPERLREMGRAARASASTLTAGNFMRDYLPALQRLVG
jgi:glycosyltransferase involved in cell wall biosynthesis